MPTGRFRLAFRASGFQRDTNVGIIIRPYTGLSLPLILCLNETDHTNPIPQHIMKENPPWTLLMARSRSRETYRTCKPMLT